MGKSMFEIKYLILLQSCNNMLQRNYTTSTCKGHTVKVLKTSREPKQHQAKVQFRTFFSESFHVNSKLMVLTCLMNQGNWPKFAVTRYQFTSQQKSSGNPGTANLGHFYFHGITLESPLLPPREGVTDMGTC